MYNSQTTKYMSKSSGINYSGNNGCGCCGNNYKINKKINPMYDIYNSNTTVYKPKPSTVNMFRTPYSSK
jgi:hypothetical protein